MGMEKGQVGMVQLLSSSPSPTALWPKAMLRCGLWSTMLFATLCLWINKLLNLNCGFTYLLVGWLEGKWFNFPELPHVHLFSKKRGSREPCNKCVYRKKDHCSFLKGQLRPLTSFTPTSLHDEGEECEAPGGSHPPGMGEEGFGWQSEDSGSSLRMALTTRAHVSCLTTDGGSFLSDKGNERGNLLVPKCQHNFLKKIFIYKYFCCQYCPQTSLLSILTTFFCAGLCPSGWSQGTSLQPPSQLGEPQGSTSVSVL